MKPTCVTTDKLASYRKAIRKSCGRKVIHRTSKYLNNRIEQDHRGIKHRYGPTLGFKSFDCAAVWCAGVDEVRQLFRTRMIMKETISLAHSRQLFRQSVTDFQQIFLSCPVADAKGNRASPPNRQWTMRGYAWSSGDERVLTEPDKELV